MPNPPVTGSAELNSFLVDVKNAINTAAKPLAGWKLSDFEAGVSEVISDKRDLIDIVTAWDDLVNIRNNFETEVARYETLYSDSKVLGNQYQEYADTFSQIMEWWDQNVRLIEDIEAFMIEVNEETSAAASSASAAKTSETNAKTSETNAGNSASSASSSASSAATSASAAASSASAAATSETNADESENVALEASAAAIVAAINVAQYTGTGFPNGVVTAPVGSIYTDTAATNGAIRWIKVIGTGNTGWKAEYGETPRRHIVSGFYSDTEGIILDSGVVIVSRTNSLVTFTLYNLKVDKGDISSLAAQIPAGFRPLATMNFPGVIGAAPGARLSVTSAGAVRLYGLSTATWQDHFFSLNWDTSDPWPTTLPGTPV